MYTEGSHEGPHKMLGIFLGTSDSYISYSYHFIKDAIYTGSIWWFSGKVLCSYFDSYVFISVGQLRKWKFENASVL